MPIDLHYICKQGENHRMIWEGIFDTGNWTADSDTCDLAINGRIFLHVNQKSPAWRGGNITGWRAAPSPENHRKIFTFEPISDFRVTCPVPWARQSAIVWWNDDRTDWMTRDEYFKNHKRQKESI